MPNISDIKLIRTDTTLDLSQKAEKRCPFAVFAPYLNLRLVAIKRGAKTMNRGRQQLSLAVCDAPPPLHADRGPRAFFRLCVCSSSYCGLAYAAAANTCTWQRREKYVACRTRVCLVARVERRDMAFCGNSVIWCHVSMARSAVNGRLFVFVRDAF